MRETAEFRGTGFVIVYQTSVDELSRYTYVFYMPDITRATLDVFKKEHRETKRHKFVAYREWHRNDTRKSNMENQKR